MAAEALVRVALADEQRGFIEAIALVLEAEDDLTVVGVATDRQELASLCERRFPDVVVVGADALAPPGGLLRWLALVSGLDAARCVHLLRSGATGAASKERPASELLAGVRTVGSGGLWVPPGLAGSVIGFLLKGAPQLTPGQQAVARLSEREREVLLCLTRGLGQQAIAAELYLSPNTVRTHVRNVLVKLGVRTSLEAVALARRASGGPGA